MTVITGEKKQSLNPILQATLKNPLNAYMLIGDDEETLKQALLFGASLKCHDGGCLKCPVCLQVLEMQNPDVMVFERSGAYLSADDARKIVALSKRTPKSGKFQILIVTEVHLLTDAAPILLKTVEEPPETTVMILLTTHLEPKLETLKSRCLQVKIKQKPTQVNQIDTSSSSILKNLNGTSIGITNAVNEYFSNIESNIAALKESQRSEIEEFKGSVEMQGKGNMTLLRLFEEQQKRQVRKARNLSQRAILSGLQKVIMSPVYDGILSDSKESVDFGGRFKAVDRINIYLKNLDRNPNDNLQITALFIDLSEIFS